MGKDAFEHCNKDAGRHLFQETPVQALYPHRIQSCGIENGQKEGEFYVEGPLPAGLSLFIQGTQV